MKSSPLTSTIVQKIGYLLASIASAAFALLSIITGEDWQLASSILLFMTSFMLWIKASEYYQFFITTPFMFAAAYIETSPFHAPTLFWLMLVMIFVSGMMGYSFGIYHASLNTGFKNRMKQAIFPGVLLILCAGISHWMFPHPFFTFNVCVTAITCYSVALHNVLAKPTEFTWAERTDLV